MVSASRHRLPCEKQPRASAAGVAAMLLASALVLSGLRVPALAAPSDASPAPAKEPTFAADVLPIFERNCLRCHDAKRKKGGLDLSTPERVLAGGESGPVVVPKQPTASKLL